MTDVTGAESAAEGQENPAPVDGEQQPPETQTPPQEPAEVEKKGNAEAARYRTQLRAAEASIADHESHIAELQEYVIAGMISDRVGDPKVFGRLVDREAWAGEDGRIDVAKLDESVTQLLEEHPSLKLPGKPRPRTSPQPNRGAPVGGAAAPAATSAIDKAFPRSGATMRDMLGKRPEPGSVADSRRAESKNVRVRGRIGGEDE